MCPRSIGTRQALLQGRLLCVGIVWLANVPDLVLWVIALADKIRTIICFVLKQRLFLPSSTVIKKMI
jgi:hypothetical protein